MKDVLRFGCFLGAALLVTACATTGPTYRANPKLYQGIQVTKAVVLVPFKTDVYQISAGGVTEKIDEWSEQARRNVTAAIEKTLSVRPGLSLRLFDETLLTEEERVRYEETEALFDAVIVSVTLHTYGPSEYLFAEKISSFEYSLGPEVGELSDGADALLLVSCLDHISTGGRKALQAGGAILGAIAGVYVQPRMGITAVTVTLVDARTGAILLYNWHGSQGGHDLRDPVDTNNLVTSLLKDFPF